MFYMETDPYMQLTYLSNMISLGEQLQKLRQQENRNPFVPDLQESKVEEPLFTERDFPVLPVKKIEKIENRK